MAKIQNINIRIDSVGRASCRIDRELPYGPDFTNGRTRAFLLGNLAEVPEKIGFSVSISPEKDAAADFRATDFEGHLMNIRLKHIGENGVVTFSPFTHGNFVVVVQRSRQNTARILIRKIGVRRQDVEQVLVNGKSFTKNLRPEQGDVWVVVEHHFDGEVDLSVSEANIATQLRDHLHKFIPALQAMWQEVVARA